MTTLSLFDLPRMLGAWPNREPEPQEDPPKPPLATERQNEAETGSSGGPTADPPKEPTGHSMGTYE